MISFRTIKSFLFGVVVFWSLFFGITWLIMYYFRSVDSGDIPEWVWHLVMIPTLAPTGLMQLFFPEAALNFGSAFIVAWYLIIALNSLLAGLAGVFVNWLWNRRLTLAKRKE